ncbi:MAG: SgcJ/EcaC family oxidoreductase [Nitrososphaerota archaeon]|nr:SgcJ/EcaC family oxidoreductase [Nitrososphaerota archaeon]
MKADSRTETEVLSVMEHFRTATAEQKGADFMELFAKDPDTFLLGSGPRETVTGQTEFKAFSDQICSMPSAIVFEWDKCTVSCRDAVAWVYLEGTFHLKGGGADETRHPYRITAVLEKRDDKWLIIQWHRSRPVS